MPRCAERRPDPNFDPQPRRNLPKPAAKPRAAAKGECARTPPLRPPNVEPVSIKPRELLTFRSRDLPLVERFLTQPSEDLALEMLTASHQFRQLVVDFSCRGVQREDLAPILPELPLH